MSCLKKVLLENKQRKMKVIITIWSLVASIALADVSIKIDSKGYVTFSSLASPTELSAMSPNPSGASSGGDAGSVYFHHRFTSNDGSDFRVRGLWISVDPDGDGIYTNWTDVSALPTPGSGNPGYYLLRNGVVLSNQVIRNAVCDEVVVLNHSFLGRSFTGGVKWKLETDYSDSIQLTTHTQVKPLRLNEAGQGISIQEYNGEIALVAKGSPNDSFQYSYNLLDWFIFDALSSSEVFVYLNFDEVGQPRKFFRVYRSVS